MRLKIPARTPLILQKLLPGLHFSVPSKEKIVYLTFDDGPLPDSCNWILDCLREYQARASFFLVGENAAANPDLMRQIMDEGHRIGNHTHNHLNGFKTAGKEYADNVRLCQNVLQPYLKKNEAPLFRPPYGKIRPGQIRNLRKAGFEIILWDVLSKDYDPTQNPDAIFHNVVDNAGPGSILVFHDNIKSNQNLRLALPRILKHLSEKGFRFDALSFPGRN